MQPDQIQRDYYPSLTLAEVYATITYYLLNKDAVDAYVERGRRIEDAFYQEWLQQEPHPATIKLRELRRRQREGGARE